MDVTCRVIREEKSATSFGSRKNKPLADYLIFTSDIPRGSSNAKRAKIRRRKGRWNKIERMLTAPIQDDIPMLRQTRPDMLTSARFVPPSLLKLQFEDGKTFDLNISALGIPIKEADWKTIAASADGNSVTVMAIDGDVIPVTARRLRYLADKPFADELRRTLHASRPSREELRELSRGSSPPAGFFPESEETAVIES